MRSQRTRNSRVAFEAGTAIWTLQCCASPTRFLFMVNTPHVDVFLLDPLIGELDPCQRADFRFGCH